MRITETTLVTLALIAVANAAVTITAKCRFSTSGAILGYSGDVRCTAEGSDGSKSKMERSWSQLVPRYRKACENVGIVCAEVDRQDAHWLSIYFDGLKKSQWDGNAKCYNYGTLQEYCENSGTFDF